MRRHVNKKCFYGKPACSLVCWATGKEKPARFLEKVVLLEAFCGNFKNKLCSSLCYHIILLCTCFCDVIWLIFSMLYCKFSCFID